VDRGSAYYVCRVVNHQRLDEQSSNLMYALPPFVALRYDGCAKGKN